MVICFPQYLPGIEGLLSSGIWTGGRQILECRILGVCKVFPRLQKRERPC